MVADVSTERVREIAARLFNVSLSEVPEDAAAGTLKQWDSMGHLMLILELEQEYSRQFSPDQVERMTSLRSIAQILEQTA